jgi:hypothetical protein
VFVTRLEKLTKGKQSSLLRKSVIYGQKGFITLGPDFNVLKLFFNFVNDFTNKKARVFVPGEPLERSLIFARKVRMYTSRTNSQILDKLDDKSRKGKHSFPIDKEKNSF